MRRSLILFTILISAIIAGSLYYLNKDASKESILFFPLDQSVIFTSADTTLTLLDEKDNDEYVIVWESSSILDREVYLRQDLSFLFADGRLIATLSEWEDNSKKIAQFMKISGEDSSHYETISYHHGEIHYSTNTIRSTQRMSFDHLYVIDSSFTPLQSFRTPETNSQEEWKNILNNVKKQQQNFITEKLAKHFDIDLEQYIQLPLTKLAKYNDSSLFNLDKNSSQQVIGKIWEGLYKNYFLGIKNEDGTIIKAIDSTEPMILISQDYSHLYIIFETAEGKPVQLIQYLSVMK